MVYEIEPGAKAPAPQAPPGMAERRWEWQITPEEGAKKPGEEAPKKVPNEFVFPKKFEEPTALPTPPPTGEKIDVTFNFMNADIREVINVILGDFLKLNYVVDRKVAGAITLHAVGKFYKEELMDIIQLMLNVNGLAMIVKEDVVEVTTIQEARQRSPNVYIGDDIQERGEDIITQIVPLEYIAPQGIIPTLRGFMTQAGFVVAPNDAHALVISEQASNMERVLSIIKMFDLSVFAGKALKFYDIKHVDVKGLAKELEGVAQSLGAVTKGARVEMSFTPFTESNRLLVATRTPELLSTIDLWIQNIDLESEQRVTRLYIYKLQHQKAKDIQPVLTQLYSEKISGQTAPTKPGAPKPPTEGKPGAPPIQKTEAGAVIREQPMRIIADESTNSLIIKALPADYQEIRSIIEALDASPQQVLIEVVIAEVKLTEALKEGVELFLKNKLKTVTETTDSTTSVKKVGGKQISTTNLVGLAGAGGLLDLTFGSVQTIFEILATESSINFLSTPHLVVRDDQKASIQVGEDVPTNTSQATGISTIGIVQQVQYRSVGIIFTVTPHIAENGMVTLDITEEASEIGELISVGGLSNPKFTTRKAETSLVIKGGNTVLLGGIIQSKQTNSFNKVPVLGDIPVLGYLFKSIDKKDERTELLVLITPHVINTATDAEILTKEFEERVKSLQRLIKGETIGKKAYYEKG
ncbi:MAG TPA: type II secretion system secretin GspD, partial [Candidatus Brocadiales bacterium]|nr:type II secretion system secretin GspD [Candidatus Brocadiales bacterium]